MKNYFSQADATPRAEFTCPIRKEEIRHQILSQANRRESRGKPTAVTGFKFPIADEATLGALENAVNTYNKTRREYVSFVYV